MSFAEFGLVEPLVRAVAAEGYTRPTPIQSAAIPAALSGRDVVGLAQTGTGKTAAFALPVLQRLLPPARRVPPQAGAAKPSERRRIRALILSPTRELAQQIGDSFATYGRHTDLRFAVVVGGVGMQPQIRAVRQGVDILIATPGRLEDLRRQGYIDLRSVEVFVLDEADRMLDIGFLPDIQRITQLLPPNRQTLFFSATMPDAVRSLADSILRDPQWVELAPARSTTELITQHVCFVNKPQKTRLLAGILQQQPVTRAIVFTRTKHGADRVAEQLEKVGIRAEAIHGNKSQAARQRSLARFRSSRPPVLVATDLAARGIDVDGVSHVVNYDLPIEPEVYVHRIGRTGRAGATGIAVSFCDETERKLLTAIERLLRNTLPTNRELHIPEVPHVDRPQDATRRPAQRPGQQHQPRRFPASRKRFAGTGRRNGVASRSSVRS